MRKKRRFDVGTMDSVNVTSLVDVTMVLLIVFIIMVPVVKEAMDISLAGGQKSTSTDLKKKHLVTIQADGTYAFNSEATDLHGLCRTLERLHVQNPALRVYIKAHTQVRHEQVVRTMSRIQALGIKEVGVVLPPDA